MRSAHVFYKGEPAGILTQLDDGSFLFEYNVSWLNADSPSISHTLPKAEKEFCSDYLFPFFYNMLPEGANKAAACFFQKIDQADHFSLLLTTAQHDTIGAVTVEKIA